MESACSTLCSHIQSSSILAEESGFTDLAMYFNASDFVAALAATVLDMVDAGVT